MHPSNYQLFQGTDYFHHPRKILCGSSQAVPKPSGHAYDFNHHELVLHVLNMYKGKDQFSSVAQLCPTFCDPVNHSMPGLPVQHQLPKDK